MLKCFMDICIDFDRAYAFALEENPQGVPAAWRDAKGANGDRRRELVGKSKPKVKIYLDSAEDHSNATVVITSTDKDFWPEIIKLIGWRIVDDVLAVDRSKIALATASDAGLKIWFDLGGGRSACHEFKPTFAESAKDLLIQIEQE